MIDLDRFKTVNDRLGHAVGDHVLAEVARRLRGSLRSSDLVARIGGEEFLMVGQVGTPAEAVALAERVRKAVGGASVVAPGGAAVTITASIGLALHDLTARTTAPARTVACILDDADRALLQAKAVGRDRVQTATGTPRHVPQRLAGTA